MIRGTRPSWLLAAFSGLIGWLVFSQACRAVALQPAKSTSLVIVVDGAGGFEASSKTISRCVVEMNLPLEVRSFHWTHGYLRVAADQMHASHMRREAQKLADLVLSCRNLAPGNPIFLVGHSAGCGLVLWAADQLPPGTLEGIVLLAPAVSADHDLRPALASSRRGIDVFISHHDWACLSLGTMLAGTTDRCFTRATGGRLGFRPIITCPADGVLYQRLRQYPWDSSLLWTGHKGGHYGSYQPMFLRLFVLPLLMPNDQPY